jgi:hypothetical protein
MMVLPGLFIGAIFAVVLPIRSVEGAGVLGSFLRSARLTSGHRWPIFGLLVGFYLLTTAAEISVNLMVGDPALAGFGEVARNNDIAAFGGSILVETCSALIDAVGTAVLYFELRDIKDGLRPEAVAAEFE